ncbi:MAG: glycosyltransferase, partial [Gammaproteobacteria bacterium]|nr:glycosyltransferase [Gammaproteobacteria bacterium]
MQAQHLPESRVTVAVPTWNRSGLLKICLESILAQDYEDFCVVVLDNASSDDT